MAMATRIAFQTRAAQPIPCMILTNGAATGRARQPARSERRGLDVAPHAPRPIRFVGSHRIHDGTPVRSLECSLALVPEHLVSPLLPLFCGSFLPRPVRPRGVNHSRSTPSEILNDCRAA